MQRLSLALYRHLANGAPVDMQDLAVNLLVPQADVVEILAAFPASQFEFDPEKKSLPFAG